MMKARLCILTVVLFLGTTPAHAAIYPITVFETSLPTFGDWFGDDPVGDRGDKIGQIGDEQAWFCFDITEIPDSEEIISASFTVRMRDYAIDSPTQRTLWYDPDDDWLDTWHHDPDIEEAKEVSELVATISFNHDGWAWITTDVDINQHDWSNDLVDNLVTLMLTGPLKGYYSAGKVDFRNVVLELETISAPGDMNDYGTLLYLGPEELVQADGLDIQVPGCSVPSFVDWNNDKLNDLVISEGGGFGDANVRVYLNVGTESEPKFSDYFYARSNSSDLTCPALGCLGCFSRVDYWDADERKDLLVGQADGTVKIFLNIGTDESPMFDGGTLLQVGKPGSKTNIDVGARATPSFVDWNNDDRKDLVVGAYDARIHIFINEGTDTEPDFLVETFANENGSDLAVPGKRASPVIIDLDGDGNKDLLTGNTDGQLLFYRNIGTDAKPSFSGYSLIESSGVPIDLPGSPRSRPFICYWTGDGHFGPIDAYPDVLIGADDGKVHLYRGIPEIGDMDGNGNVDIADLALFADYWSQTDCGQCGGADFTGDGNVDIDDLTLFIEIWLSGLEQQSHN